MSCDKCEDIHIAQRAGKQSDECHCSCHSGRIDYGWSWNPLTIPDTGTPPWQQHYTTCQGEDQHPYKVGREKLP